MGFKVGDTVRHNECSVKDCSSLNKVGKVTAVWKGVQWPDQPAPDYADVKIAGGITLTLKFDEMSLVTPVEAQAVKVETVYHPEDPVPRVEFTMADTFDPERISKLFAEDIKNAGRKDDKGKDQWDLLLGTALLPAVKVVLAVLIHGAVKYGDDNWLKVQDARNRYYNALLRHLSSWKLGNKYDDEPKGSGLPSMAHVICCALFLLAFDLIDGVLPGGVKPKS